MFSCSLSFAQSHLQARDPFLEAPDNYRTLYGVSFSIPDESFRRFKNFTVKLSAKETNWTSFEVRTHPTLLENLISKYDIGPFKLPGLSRNRPLARNCDVTMSHTWISGVRDNVTEIKAVIF